MRMRMGPNVGGPHGKVAPPGGYVIFPDWQSGIILLAEGRWLTLGCAHRRSGGWSAGPPNLIKRRPDEAHAVGPRSSAFHGRQGGRWGAVFDRCRRARMLRTPANHLDIPNSGVRRRAPLHANAGAAPSIEALFTNPTPTARRLVRCCRIASQTHLSMRMGGRWGWRPECDAVSPTVLQIKGPRRMNG